MKTTVQYYFGEKSITWLEASDTAVLLKKVGRRNQFIASPEISICTNISVKNLLAQSAYDILDHKTLKYTSIFSMQLEIDTFFIRCKIVG